MTRFTAFASDTSEDEEFLVSKRPTKVISRPLTQKNLRLAASQDDHDDDAEDDDYQMTGSGSSQEELPISPRRTRRRPDPNALVEGKDGEYYHAREIDDDELDSEDVETSDSDESDSKPQNGRKGESQPIPWAQRVGVDPQKMHVMQASLFRLPEEEAAMKAQAASTARPRKPHLTWANDTLHRKHSRESDGDLRLATGERASFAQDMDVIPYLPSRKYARVESSASAVFGSESAVVDAGLALGRSFRVGWGPGGMLIHLGSICTPHTSAVQTANSSTLTLRSVPFTQPNVNPTGKYEKLLAHHLSLCTLNVDNEGVPFVEPPPRSLNFSSFASLYSSTDQSFEAQFFRLGHALFDPIQLRLHEDADLEVLKRISDLRRKTELTAWLEEAVASAVDTDVKNSLAEPPKAIFALLTGNQIEKACQVAMESHNVKLATLISQAGGDYDFVDHLRAQIDIWQRERIDVHMNENMRKIYALLAGYVHVFHGSDGTGIETCKDVEIATGLDWKRVFGLHLWFAQPLDATIAEVFDSYEKHWKQMDEYARTNVSVASPIPWYSQTSNGEHQHATSLWRLPNGAEPCDGLYSLIQLHAQPGLSLSHIMSPLSYGTSPVDFSLPWHLYIIISRCLRIRDLADRDDPKAGRLGFGSEEEGLTIDNLDDEVEGHSPSADVLASSYALQLEQLNLIQEATFVLLHIEGSAGREKAIKDLLARSAPKLDQYMTQGLVGSLHIPFAWVNEAKALHAFNEGNFWEAYQLYVSAGQYNAAHDIAVLELAPEAVIRDDLELLRSLFVKMNGKPVESWHVRGKAFLDYVTIRTRVPVLRGEIRDAEVPDAAQATELEELSRSIPKLIGILPDVLRDRADPRHNVALSEMISKLTLELDTVQPLMLSQSQTRPMLVDEVSKLRHVQSVAHTRFLTLVQDS